jgi:hypothetical protein
MLGDMDMVLWAGEGVVSKGDPWLDMWSPSERAWPIILGLEAARAAAVAAAASSMVPLWWFWCLVKVVRRVNVF